MRAILGTLGLLMGGVAAVWGLRAHRILSHGMYSSPRHEDVGGGFLLLVDACVAFVAGGILGLRLAWLVGSWLATNTGEAVPSGGRLSERDLGLLLPLLILTYLIYVSNFL